LEYKAQQEENDIKRKEQSVILNHDLEKMRHDVQQRRHVGNTKSVQEDKKIEAWVSRKAAQVQLKAELEKKLFL
jgi:hypothetical protein